MAINFPGPWGVEIKYTVVGVIHKMNLNCNVSAELAVGTDWSAWTLLTRIGGNTLLSNAVSAMGTAIVGLLTTEGSLISADLYKYTPLSSDRVWYSSTTLTGTGGSINPTGLAQYQMYTFRTQEGNVMRGVVLEGNFDQNNTKIAASAGSASQLAFMNAMEGDNQPWLARDTSYPISRLNISSGQNEQLWRTRFR